MDAVRTAVVGVGHIGRIHAAKYAEDPGAQLVGVVDLDRSRADAAAGECGCRALDDHRALVGAVDAVSIAVPTPAHFAIARFFLEHDVHVLIEKPIARDTDEADALIALARARGRVLQVGHLERFFAHETGLLAAATAPVYIEAARVAPFGGRGTEVSVVLDLMIHDIDLVLALVRAPVVRVDAVGSPVLTDHEDLVNARLAFATGCVANITASRVAFKSERKMRIFQPDRLFNVDLLKRRVTTVRKSPGRAPDGTADPARTAFEVDERQLSEHDALGAQIRAFVQSVREGTRPLVSGEDGRAALAMGTRIIESLRAHAALVTERMGGDRA